MLKIPFFHIEMAKLIQTSNEEIEIQVDLDDSRKPVQYRFLGQDKWLSSPFLGENFRRDGGEKDALKAVSKWIELGGY